MTTLEELQALVHDKFGIPIADLDPNASMREKGFDSLALVECCSRSKTATASR